MNTLCHSLRTEGAKLNCSDQGEFTEFNQSWRNKSCAHLQ